MTYMALLRGINVGGKNTVEMARLRQLFEVLGYTDVKTVINSGNIIFTTPQHVRDSLTCTIEKAIEKEFGFEVPVLLRNQQQLEDFLKQLPEDWVNDDKTRCDILFLWDSVDGPDAINKVKIKPEIEEIKYLPGALAWRIDRKNVKRGSLIKIIGTDFYKQVTIRNPNTVRKIYTLMQS